MTESDDNKINGETAIQQKDEPDDNSYHSAKSSIDESFQSLFVDIPNVSDKVPEHVSSGKQNPFESKYQIIETTYTKTAPKHECSKACDSVHQSERVHGHEKADFSRFYLHDRPLLDKQKECGQCSSFVQHNKDVGVAHSKETASSRSNSEHSSVRERNPVSRPPPCPRGSTCSSRGLAAAPLGCPGRWGPNPSLSAPTSKSVSQHSSPRCQGSATLSGPSRATSMVSEGPVCRICREGDGHEVLISPCYCAGSLGLLHVTCLQTWLGSSNNTSCEICGFHFSLVRETQPFYRFLESPGSARDRRDLHINMAAFLIVTPLTVLTTWLCLAGAVKYYDVSGAGQAGLITLAVLLLGLYAIWLAVCVRQTWTLWREWRLYHQDVTLLCEPAHRQHGSRNHRHDEQTLNSIRFNVTQHHAHRSRSQPHSGQSDGRGYSRSSVAIRPPVHQGQGYLSSLSETEDTKFAKKETNVEKNNQLHKIEHGSNEKLLKGNNCNRPLSEADKSLVDYVNNELKGPRPGPSYKNNMEIPEGLNIFVSEPSVSSQWVKDYIENRCSTEKYVIPEKQQVLETGSGGVRAGIFSRGHSPPEGGAARRALDRTDLTPGGQLEARDHLQQQAGRGVRPRCERCAGGAHGECPQDHGHTERLI